MRTPSFLLAASLLVTIGCSAPAPEPQQVAKAEAAAQLPSVPETKPQAPTDAKTPPEPKPKRKTKAQLDAERRTYTFQLERLDKDIAGVQQLVDEYPTIANWARLAGNYTTRARLTGSYDDYATAEKHLATAFETKGPKPPHLQRARFNYSLHRMDRVDADLSIATRAPPRTPEGAASLLAFKANVAFQRGQYEQAKTLFEQSISKKRLLGNMASYAVYHWKTGAFEEAEQFFVDSLKLYHGKPTEPVAWIHLNLGLLDLDRGRYDDALAHYREAETHIKGYWLIDEHVAEILTLQGKTDEAKLLYLDIIERTQNPEFMDAMAGMMREAGKETEAQAYIAQARARYEAQMAQFPEAAYGHALGHYLEFGDDPAFTLDLAKKNYALRPNGESATLLAEAYLAADEPKKAAKQLKPWVKSPFRSADLFLAAAAAARATGSSKDAEGFTQQARDINPHATPGPG